MPDVKFENIVTSKEYARAIKIGRRHGTHPNLSRFIQPYRQHITALTCCSEQLRDLIDSFPAMLFALTTNFGTADDREECVRLVNAGGSLKKAAEVLGLPFWLRKIPAGALRQPFMNLPNCREFNLQIANFIPKSDSEIRYWLRRVLFACAACDTDYGLWMARHRRFPFRDRAIDPHVLIAAWAWFSRHPKHRAYKYIRRPWSPNMSLSKAYEEAKVWEQRLGMAVKLGNGLRDTWLDGGRVGEFEIVPLITVDDFLNEAQIMNNCLDQYGDQLTREHMRVFSIRLAGEHVADLEIGVHEDEASMPAIEQLRGPKNKRAGGEVWQAAYAWLGSQTIRPMKTGVKGGKQIGAKVRKSIWGPYLDALEDVTIRSEVEQYAFEGKMPRRNPRNGARAQTAQNRLDVLVNI